MVIVDHPALTHVQVVGGNRLPPGTTGALVRIEGVLLPGLEEEMTRAVWVGASTKDVEAMLSTTGGQEPTASDQARGLLLNALREAGGQMESDQLDATVAEATGLKASTVRNLRGQLKEKGWIRPVPEKDDTGAVLRWMVKLTNAAPAAPDHLARAGVCKSRDLDYSSQIREPDHDFTTPARGRDLAGDLDVANATESLFSEHLVDERGRCVRHPDEPKPWCLECKAAVA
jgi:hypothetical protein